MSEPTPSLSVIMSVFNGASFLKAALESVLNQTYTDFEFLIIDDGSTDPRCAEILDRFAKSDSRIHLKCRENRGLPATLNELAEMARAPWLVRMDADDICDPERFEKQMRYLKEHPNVDVLGTWVLVIDEDGRPIHPAEMPLKHEAIDDTNLDGRAGLVHPTVIMRKTKFIEVGGYDTAYTVAQDLDLWLRLGEVARMANVPEPLLQYRINATAISSQKSDQQATLARKACVAAWARRDLPERSVKHVISRPSTDRASRRDFALKWGWQAWNAGYRTTARYMFAKALRIDPLSLASWKGMIFGMLRRPKPDQ